MYFLYKATPPSLGGCSRRVRSPGESILDDPEPNRPSRSNCIFRIVSVWFSRSIHQATRFPLKSGSSSPSRLAFRFGLFPKSKNDGAEKMRFVLLLVASVLGFAAFAGNPVEIQPGKIIRERISWRPVVETTVEDIPGVKIVEREPILDRIRARRAFEASRVESVVEAPVARTCVGGKCRDTVSSVRTRSRGFLARLFRR